MAGDLKSLVSALSAEKRAKLLERLMTQRATGAKGADAGGELSGIVSVGRGGPLPLSFSETRLWFLEQYEPGGASYAIPVARRIVAPLDVEVLRGALGDVVGRHESLRTRYMNQGDEPQRVIDEPSPFVLQQTSLEHVEPSQREDRARAWLTEQTGVPFDLAKGPMFRASLLRLGPDDHVLLLTMHHIASDGWSLGILLRELGAFYSARVEKRESTLPELPIQYADYAAWERSEARRVQVEPQVAAWKTHLAGVPALELPVDRPRPLVQSTRGARFDFMLDEALTSALQALARQQGSTLFMVLLSGFATVLSRHSGQRDFAIGTPVARRTQLETEGVVGFLVNTLALRLDLGGQPTARKLLERVREETLSAFAHQDVPFERLVEHTGRDTSRSPLFQAMFILQNAPTEAVALGAARAQVFPFDTGVSKFDLTLHVFERNARLAATFEYATALFRPRYRRRVGRTSGAAPPWNGRTAGPLRRRSALLLSDQERQSPLGRPQSPPPRTIPATPPCMPCSKPRSTAAPTPSPSSLPDNG